MGEFIFIIIMIFVMHLNCSHAERSYHHSVKQLLSFVHRSSPIEVITLAGLTIMISKVYFVTYSNEKSFKRPLGFVEVDQTIFCILEQRS